MKKLSKRMAALSTKIEDRVYEPLEAIGIIKENANAKFDETIEAHIRLGIDPKYTDQQLKHKVVFESVCPSKQVQNEAESLFLAKSKLELSRFKQRLSVKRSFNDVSHSRLKVI